MGSGSTKLDLILELWNTHGIFALGWIFVVPMAGYIVLLHSRIGTIYKEYLAAIQAANAAVVPLLEKSVEVMTHVIGTIDSAVDAATNRDRTMDDLKSHMVGLKGQLDIVIRTFIGERHYTQQALDVGFERARQTAVSTARELENTRASRSMDGDNAE